MNYLDFIEEYNNENINLFEKTLLTIKRTKDIYNGKTTAFNNKNKYRPLDCAIYEINKEYIQPKFEEISNKDLENFDIEESATNTDKNSLNDEIKEVNKEEKPQLKAGLDDLNDEIKEVDAEQKPQLKVDLDGLNDEIKEVNKEELKSQLKVDLDDNE